MMSENENMLDKCSASLIKITQNALFIPTDNASYLLNNNAFCNQTDTLMIDTTS